MTKEKQKPIYICQANDHDGQPAFFSESEASEHAKKLNGEISPYEKWRVARIDHYEEINGARVIIGRTVYYLH